MSGASVIEAMLLRWGESPAGRTVTFLLPDDGAQHPFKGLKTGPSYGQRVALSVALISDDETQTPAPGPKPPLGFRYGHVVEQTGTVAPAKPKDRKRWSELPLSQQAAIRCNDPDFQTYLVERFGGDGEVPAECVREYCAVKSRKNISLGDVSGKLWSELDADYRFWLSQRGAA